MGATDTRFACLQTQQMLDNILARNNNITKTLPTLGFTNALKSPENTSGFEAIQTQFSSRATSSSNRKVLVTYRTPTCKAVSDGEADVCTSGTPETADYDDQEVYVSQYKHRTITLDRNLYADLCEGINEAAAFKVADAALDLLKNENTYLLTQAEADLDNYFAGGDSSPDGTDIDTLKLFTTASVINPAALFKLKEQYNRKGYTSASPILIGGTGVSAWAQVGQIYRNSTEGLSPDLVPYNISAFIDYQVDAVFTAGGGSASNQYAMSFIPGHAQRLLWHKFGEGSPTAVRKESITKEVITLQTPNGPEMFDYTVYDNDCAEEVVLTIGRGFDLWTPPTAAFDGEGDCKGQETLLGWMVDCGALTCDDTVGYDGGAVVE